MEIVSLVVPVYNEADRWNRGYWVDLLSLDSVHWIFVDDGSSDTTSEKLRDLPHSLKHEILRLSGNRGKGEAIRAGFLFFFGSDSDGQALGALRAGTVRSKLVGFLDADAAFSKEDISRILSVASGKILRDPSRSFPAESVIYNSVWASRVAMSGRKIIRTPSRHYLGRIVSTLLSPFVPSMPYDSQCGFKIFEASDEFKDAIATPFKTRWFFDLEILIKWGKTNGSRLKIWEEPLDSWTDIPGSHLSAKNVFGIVGEIIKIIRDSRGSNRGS